MQRDREQLFSLFISLNQTKPFSLLRPLNGSFPFLIYIIFALYQESIFQMD